jgi:predicted MFS family arabinose efflux permease
MTAVLSSGRVRVRGLWQVRSVFALHGCFCGTFAARLPAIANHLGLSNGWLGVALLMPSFGTITTAHLSARVTARLGTRGTLLGYLLIWSGVMVLIPLAPSLPLLAPALLMFGVCAVGTDVAMNDFGVAVENEGGRPIMASLHGMWSVGGLVGSSAAALAARAGMGPRPDLALVAVVVAVLAVTVTRTLPPHEPSGEEEPAPAPRRHSAWPTRGLLAIALLMFCSMFGESAGQDWSAVYLNRVSGAGMALAATAYTALALAMVLGRLTGDAIVARLGPVTTVRISGLIAAAGCAVVVAFHAPAAAMAGFALLGLGIAVVVPLCFGAAGNYGGGPAGHGIAAVATLGYGAGMAAPSAIGGVAGATSLPTAFVVVGVVCAAISPLPSPCAGAADTA